MDLFLEFALLEGKALRPFNFLDWLDKLDPPIIEWLSR